MALGADLARAATGLVNPEVSGIDATVSPAVDRMLTAELGQDFTSKGPSIQP